MDEQMLAEFLDTKARQYNNSAFIANDPISIPHRFTQQEDIEIAGFLAASLAWGNRKAIIKSASQLISWMDNAPADFIHNADSKDIKIFEQFVYRTFNGFDCIFFIEALRNIYANHQGLSGVFKKGYSANNSIKEAIIYFRGIFFDNKPEVRTNKHVANPLKGSAAKRINMYLRWMVRQDNQGVDFGIWDFIPMSALQIPLDVHTGTISRKLALLKRKQNDWKAVEELSNRLREFDPKDPIKYDYALFGVGVNNDF